MFYVLRIPLNAALTPLIQVSRRQVRVGSGPPALQAGSFSALISGPDLFFLWEEAATSFQCQALQQTL